jgi:diacylglycerol kinase family enzyme
MLGALINMRAGCARRDPDLVQRLSDLLGAGRVEATGSEDEITAALERLRSAGVEWLALVGGDGTFTGTLTQLLRCWPRDAWPAIVVTRGGTVNTIATALGARGTPRQTIQSLLEGARPSETRRELLRVHAGERPARVGFIFGMGAATRWLDAYYAEPVQGPWTATRLVARTLGSGAVQGRFAREVFEPFEAKLVLDGQTQGEMQFTLLGAATIREVGLGFQPFLSAGTEPGRFHLLHTDAPPARFALELPYAHGGTTGALSVLSHHSVAEAELDLPVPQPWMLDADVQPAARQLRIDLTPALRFLSA